MSIDKNRYDLALVFQTYFAFQGDVDRTAIALNLSNQEIEALAASESWGEKIKQWSVVKAGSSADAAIAINRVSNLVTAKRLQELINKTITHLSTMEAGALVDYLTTARKTDREGNTIEGTFSAKALTELAKAAEAVSLISARALGDTAEERPEEGRGPRGSSIAMLVQAAMAASESVGVSPVLLVREQNAIPPPAN